ncbi:MAG: T9SS type A sorting domain-containing protein, partial [Syntrophothermus sp.]
NLKVIALNSYSANDVIQHYSRGYWSTWEAEGGTLFDNIFVKMNHKGGKDTVYQGVNCWSSNYCEPKDSLVFGPHYYQDRNYRLSLYKDGLVNYKVKVNMAYEDVAITGEAACRFLVINHREEYYNGVVRDTILDTLIDVEVYPDSLYADKFNELDMGIYNFSRYPADTDNKDADLLIRKDTLDYINLGTDFIVHDYGLGVLYIDKIEVYDEDIGKYLKENLNNIRSSIQLYPLANDSSVIFWYGADEPQSIDCYKPIKLVDSLLEDLGYPRLIQAFYPQWNGRAHGDTSIHRFVDYVQPSQFMMDIFPGWSDVDWVTGMKLVKNRFKEASVKFPGFYYVPQAFGMTDINTGLPVQWRRLTTAELNASIMLSLSYGAKGLLFWNYPSYRSGKIYYHCIVDTFRQPLDFYTYLRNSFAPKINGSMGKHLLNAEYLNEHLNFYFTEPHKANENNWVSTNFEIIDDDLMAVAWLSAGLLEDKNFSESKYFFPVNLLNSGNDTYYFKAKNFNSYNNYRLREIGKPMSENVNFTNQCNFSKYFNGGDGFLFNVAPTVYGGGLLVNNDTINTEITLQDTLEISSNRTLVVNDTYTLKSILKLYNKNNIHLNTTGYITLEEEGKVLVDSFYPLIRLKTSENHPWIVWGEYNLTSPVYYKVMRSIDYDKWMLIDTTSNLYYIDTTVTINNMPSSNYEASYKVVASKLNDTLSVISDTVCYAIYENLEKETSAALTYNYNLEQNYPNPFNPQTTIRYELKEDCFVSIKVYDILGNLIKELVNENKLKGKYSTNLNVNDINLSSGIYFYNINAGEYVKTKKMVILK